MLKWKIRLCIVPVICGLGLFVVLGGCGDSDKVYLESAQTSETAGEVIGDTDSGSLIDGADPGIQVDAGDGSVTGINRDSDTGDQVSVIYVHVGGAVVSPGVYELTEGSRIYQALELAGGLTPEAVFDSVNQAENLTDGQMVYVYTQGEQNSPAVQGDSSKETKVDLNRATAQELTELPGIGQSKANAIVSWRDQNGSFGKIEDLMKIEGIKEGVFSKIKDYITVN